MKKAEITLSSAENIINFILVIGVAVFIAIVAGNFLNEKYDTHHFQSKVLTTSLLYSEDCIAYNDGAKTYPGIVDPTKIEDGRLINCFSQENLGYTIELFDLNRKSIKFSNPDFRLNNYLPICSTLPEYKCTTKQDYVLYFKDNKFSPGILTTEVITIV